ncbi:MAG: hypothetical protein JNM55_10210 [Anaerolineales bacterium]|nr:hypothetical protein [Anaerolineales bacterium]
MSDSIKQTSRVRQFSTALFIMTILFCLCGITAFYPRGFPSGSLARIPKNKVEASASREEIAEELVNVWMGKYRIGTLGWSDWIWKYEIEKVGFWDSTSECVNVRIKVITVLPSDATQWMGLYAKKDGMWVKNGYTMVVSEHDNYYELSGPYSLC